LDWEIAHAAKEQERRLANDIEAEEILKE